MQGYIGVSIAIIYLFESCFIAVLAFFVLTGLWTTFEENEWGKACKNPLRIYKCIYTYGHDTLNIPVELPDKFQIKLQILGNSKYMK